MTTQELKEYINRVLGNNIRCLLPSYWWKRLFGIVVDEFDAKTSSIGANVQSLDTSIKTLDSDVSEIRTELEDLDIENRLFHWTITANSQNAISNKKLYDIVINEFINKKSKPVYFLPGKYTRNSAGPVDYCIKAPIHSIRYFENEDCVILSNVPIEGVVYNIKINSNGLCELTSSPNTICYFFGSNSEQFINANKAAFQYDRNTTGSNYHLARPNVILYEYVRGGITQVGYGQSPTCPDGSKKFSNVYGLGYEVTISRTGEFTITEPSNETIEIDSSLSDTSENAVQNKVIKSALANKVDAIAGKQLSTEDFTTALKERLESLNNYDDTEINEAVSKLRSDFDALVSGDTTTAIKTFNEIIAFLNGIEDTENLDSIIASIEQQIAGKQDVISDIDTIRSGAALGATALQEHQDISHLATKEELESASATINETIDNLTNEILNNEEVTAAGIANLDERVVFVEDFIAKDIVETYATKEEVENLEFEVTNNEEITATALNDVVDKINRLTEVVDEIPSSYEYYKINGGVVSENVYNIMTKYLFTPFIISNNSTTTIPDELLNEDQTSFFTDYYWNFMRLTGGEPIQTTQLENNIPQKFIGICSNLSFTIDFSTKTIIPEQ